MGDVGTSQPGQEDRHPPQKTDCAKGIFREGQKMQGLTKLMSSPDIPICLEMVQFSREYPNENISQENANTFPVLGQILPCREVGSVSTKD